MARLREKDRIGGSHAIDRHRAIRIRVRGNKSRNKEPLCRWEKRLPPFWLWDWVWTSNSSWMGRGWNVRRKRVQVHRGLVLLVRTEFKKKTKRKKKGERKGGGEVEGQGREERTRRSRNQLRERVAPNSLCANWLHPSAFSTTFHVFSIARAFPEYPMSIVRDYKALYWKYICNQYRKRSTSLLSTIFAE